MRTVKRYACIAADESTFALNRTNFTYAARTSRLSSNSVRNWVARRGKLSCFDNEEPRE